jgi:ribosomal protein S27E
MECEDCGHPWVAVFPLGCVSAECPHCGHYTPTPEAYDIQPPVPEGN